MANDIPTVDDFNATRVTSPGQSEMIRQPLYDSQVYPTAGGTQLTFFQQPVGAGITSALGAVVSSGKTYADTNMVLPGQLPNGIAFQAESVEVNFLPGKSAAANTFLPADISAFAVAAAATVLGSANDVGTIMQSGWLELNILAKNYLRDQPLMKFPPKCSIDLSAAVASNSATVGEAGQVFTKAVGRPYYLEPKVTIQPTMNFEVVLKWPGAVATPSGFNGRVIVSLDGYTMRASQ